MNYNINYNINNIDLLQNILQSLQLPAKNFEQTQKRPLKNTEIDIPVHQAIYFAPHLSNSETTKRSHIITYRDSVVRGPLSSCFKFRPVPKLFWTGIRAAWTRNVPAKYRITALSNTTDMKYILYDFREILIGEWVYLPSVIPALDIDDYQLLLEFEIPKECSDDKLGCDLSVRVVGFENLIEIGDKQCILRSNTGPYNIAIYDIDDKDSEFATLSLSCCDKLSNIRPNSTEMPQWNA